MKLRAFVFLFFSVFLLSGCGPNLGFDAVEGETPSEIDDKSLLFGHVNTANADLYLFQVIIQRIDEESEQLYYGTDNDKNLFFIATLDPGTYRIAEIRTYDPNWIPLFGHRYYYDLGISRQSGMDYIVKIDEPGIYYAGAFKLEEDGNNFFTDLMQWNEYKIGTTKGPPPRELLKRLKKEAVGTPWVPRIQAALDSKSWETNHARR